MYTKSGLANLLATGISEKFEVDKDQLLANRAFIDLGLDSLTFIEVLFLVDDLLNTKSEDDDMKGEMPTNLSNLISMLVRLKKVELINS
jgi:acyl carrier protein